MKYKFEIPSELEARELLAWRRAHGMYQSDLYADALACSRALQPVTTEEERRAVREYLEDKRWSA